MLNLKNLKAEKLSFLRKQYPVFQFESFNYKHKKDDNSLIVSFLFGIPPDIKFNPTVKIESVDKDFFNDLEKDVIKNFVFNLGLVEMLSYWKATCSGTIEIKVGGLNKNQASWWKNLLIKSLGEFFYQNNINFREKNFVNFKSLTSNSFSKDRTLHEERFLTLNGGGRDTAVAFELLKELKKEIGILALNPTKASQDIANASSISKHIVVKREIDGNLLKLNEMGYLNGHTPFSAYLAFLSAFCALIFDYKYIIASNERSSNEENIEFLGEKINHQYSKSFEFEESFREYLKANLSQGLDYSSILRPVYDIQVSKIFADYKKYLNLFRSCNRGQKNNAWCKECPKCLSVYISLYPFMDEKELAKIFGEDLYAKKELLDLLLHLTGSKKPKPFECVGTYDEIIAGLRFSIKKLEKNKKSLSFLLEYAKKNIIRNNDLDYREILRAWDQKNFLTKGIATKLKEKISYGS